MHLVLQRGRPASRFRGRHAPFPRSAGSAASAPGWPVAVEAAAVAAPGADLVHLQVVPALICRRAGLPPRNDTGSGRCSGGPRRTTAGGADRPRGRTLPTADSQHLLEALRARHGAARPAALGSLGRQAPPRRLFSDGSLAPQGLAQIGLPEERDRALAPAARDIYHQDTFVRAIAGCAGLGSSKVRRWVALEPGTPGRGMAGARARRRARARGFGGAGAPPTLPDLIAFLYHGAAVVLGSSPAAKASVFEALSTGTLGDLGPVVESSRSTAKRAVRGCRSKRPPRRRRDPARNAGPGLETAPTARSS